MQKILSIREKIILYTAVAVIILSIGFNVFVGPVLERREDLNNNINLTRMKLVKYFQLLAQKDYIKDKYSNFTSNNQLSGSGQDNLVNALSELQALAKSSNIRIVDIRPQGQGATREMIIDLRAEGTLEDYLKFIHSVENSLMILQIRKLQLNAKPNSQILEGIFSIS